MHAKSGVHFLYDFPSTNFRKSLCDFLILCYTAFQEERGADMYYKKPKLLYYRLAQAVCRIVGKYLFRPQVLRNEIKDAKGPYVVIANHQSMLDF